MEKAIKAIDPDYRTFVPVELRRWKPTKRARKAMLYTVPLIPRLVFTTAPVTVSVALDGNAYFAGIERNTYSGMPWTIPNRQMEAFIATHNEWLDRERKRLKAGGRGKPAKRKWRKLDGASAGEIMVELFGPDQMEQAA